MHRQGCMDASNGYTNLNYYYTRSEIRDVLISIRANADYVDLAPYYRIENFPHALDLKTNHPEVFAEIEREVRDETIRENTPVEH